MSDAMVTARMPQAKKEAGNRVLGELGVNASQFINSAYDYLIQHGESPFSNRTAATQAVSRAQIAEALALVESMCLPASNRFREMDYDEIRRERLLRKGIEVGEGNGA